MDTPTTQFERGSFAGHETFPFRYTWLRKAVQLTRDDGGAFRSEDAMVRLGVGKNMVRSIRHWALACGVIHEDPSVRDNRGRILCPTDFGDLLIGDGGWDEYFEDPATMWLLHWQLASAATPSTTWFWTFNHAPQLNVPPFHGHPKSRDNARGVSHVPIEIKEEAAPASAQVHA